MKISIFFLVVTQLVAAQYWGRTRYPVDTLQEYTSEQEDYKFILDGKSQGLFFDSLSLKDRKRMTITITNNTTSSIIIQNYKMRDGTVLWDLHHARRDSILPNQSFSFSPHWIQRSGPFSSPIIYNYVSNGEIKTFMLRIWGWNYLPPIHATPKSMENPSAE